MFLAIDHEFAVTTFDSYKKWITIMFLFYNFAITNCIGICDAEKQQSRLPLVTFIKCFKLLSLLYNDTLNLSI